ncbi:glucosaminidase domain-containing protein [Patescibacteria group bacterium]|nr:glucosaminidase domain-containing protein [Patescibacteria group bacterium]
MNRAELEARNPGWLEKAALAAQHAAESVHGRILVSTLLAQMIDESNDGRNEPGDNALGIKATPNWHGETETFTTHEYIHGREVQLKAVFRKYPSIEDCAKDYAHLLIRLPVYAPALAMIVGRDPAENVDYLGRIMPLREAYTRKIASVYATNPLYGDDLVYLIRECVLQGFELHR